MGIFDMFRGGPNPNAVQQTAGVHDPMNPNNPNVPGNPQPPQNTQNQQNIANGNPQPNATEGSAEKPPIVDYTKLWDIDPNKKGPADLAEFKFNMDPTKTAAAFNSLDFTKNITPELMTKINAGGTEATSAFLSAMNTMVQEAVKTAVVASTQITERGIQSTGQKVKDYIPSAVREHSVQSALREDNPLMKKPEYAPMVEAVTMQMARQFPNATAAEVKEHTKKYFDSMVGDIAQSSGRQVIQQPKQTPQSQLQTDWSSEPV